MGNLVKWLTNPLVIITIVILFFIAFMVYLETSKELSSLFWKFGPTLDADGKYYKYMTFTLDNWAKVASVYIIIFLTAVVNTLYSKFYKSRFIGQIGSPSYSSMSRTVKVIVIAINPMMEMLSYIVNFFAVAAFQFQYLLPMFAGAFLAELPYLSQFLMQ